MQYLNVFFILYRFIFSTVLLPTSKFIIRWNYLHCIVILAICWFYPFQVILMIINNNCYYSNRLGLQAIILQLVILMLQLVVSSLH